MKELGSIKEIVVQKLVRQMACGAAAWVFLYFLYGPLFLLWTPIMYFYGPLFLQRTPNLELRPWFNLRHLPALQVALLAVMLPSVAFYVSFLRLLHKRRSEFPFNSSFYQLCFRLGIVDCLQLLCVSRFRPRRRRLVIITVPLLTHKSQVTRPQLSAPIIWYCSSSTVFLSYYRSAFQSCRITA